ncbi:hypothetical protein Misp01_66790 [Microtetraspora sp. NBRC 13810]|nr:hypothetical protein Misp01_66790 [Microtetraspora sp. NBRC 13810]
MNRRTAVYDLLLGYEADSVKPLQEFHAVWCRGIDVPENRTPAASGSRVADPGERDGTRCASG